MKLFAEKGYDATSIEEITATVGCQRNIILSFFKQRRNFNFFNRRRNKIITK